MWIKFENAENYLWNQIMGNQNRKASREEMAKVRKTIGQAFPGCQPVFGSHGDYGGHRAPRDHTIAFRLKNAKGQFCSNVVWLMPDALKHLTVDDIRQMVNRANGRE